MSLLSGFLSLAKDDNKVLDTTEGAVSELTPELTLDMSDEDLIDLKRQWERNWEPYAIAIRKVQDENEEYWLGNQFSEAKGKRKLVDNLIFESLETFLPIATRPKPEPIVEGGVDEVATEVADKVRKMLAYQADIQSLNLKVKQAARYWALYLLGVAKVGWSMAEDDITTQILRPQKLILDSNATIVDGVYTGEYIGEYKEETAADLIARFPDKATYIEEQVKNKLGTKVQYLEWWHKDYLFWTFKEVVLSKVKNPHWNYDTIEEETRVDEFGQPFTEEVPVEGKNHFKHARMPYIFLSIFNLGKRPHDDTNLLLQNLPLQDLINKRLLQIDKNADSTNGGLVVSGDHFTQEQGAESSETLRKGGTVWVPTGNVNDAVKRDQAPPLPNFIYESLVDYRNELRNVFGTRGSSPQGTINEQTVGGKLTIKGQDEGRIGGGISVYLEQFADNIFNWWVQLMYVYYDEPHSATVLGRERAQEHIQLINNELTSKLTVSVKEGSMIPHDPLAQRNEAVDLWQQGALDPITLFDRLEFPNPRETAKNLYLWKADPIQLFPDLLEKQQAEQEAVLQDQIAAEQAALQGVVPPEPNNLAMQ